MKRFIKSFMIALALITAVTVVLPNQVVNVEAKTSMKRTIYVGQTLKLYVIGVKKRKPTVTAGQRNALGRAKVLLTKDIFSKALLKSQLVREGYSDADAQYGVDHCGANWNQQAYAAAKLILSRNYYSKEQLVTILL